MPSPRRRLLAVPAVLVALLAGTPTAAHALDAAGLRAALAPQARALGSGSGAIVADLATGEVLYARAARTPRVPASNEKLLTTATALSRLGPETRLTTEVHLAPDATLDPDGVVRGDLRLVGAGDPSLSSVELAALAAQLERSGIRRLTGGVVGDGTRFDTRAGGPSAGFRADANLGGSLGGLVYGHGVPGALGPAQAAAARLQLALAALGVKAGVKARALAPTAALRQAAAAPADPAPATDPTTPTDPTATEPTATTQPVPDDGVLASVTSPSVAELVAATNVPSDNFYAEMLLKLVGAQDGATGTTAGGLSVVRATLAGLGVTATVADGSGLSRSDRIAPTEVLDLLTAMHASPLAASFEGSLAVAGRSGTLRKRMRGTPAQGACVAKTGTLIGVSALSGLCRVAGRAVGFSIISNGVYSPSAKRREDRMVAAIARYGR